MGVYGATSTCRVFMHQSSVCHGSMGCQAALFESEPVIGTALHCSSRCCIICINCRVPKPFAAAATCMCPCLSP